MIVYEATKELFLEDVLKDIIVKQIYKKYQEKIGKTTESEKRSWKNSMQYMSNVLLDPNIPNNAGIAIEYKIPYTSKRVDFIISGKNEKNENSAVVVELKQWEKAEVVDGKDGLIKTYLGKGERETTHPSYQVWSYAQTIEDYNKTVQDQPIYIHPCAYLHNYVKQNPDTLTAKVYEYYLQKAPVFISGEALELRKFINKYIKFGDDKETLYLIENGKIRPSKSLQDALSSMLKGKQEFIMIDDQKVVYETALQMSRKSYADGKKRVLIVQGGPGTGKSVLAVNLLVQLTGEEMVVQYVTKNSAPRNVYAAKLSGDLRKNRINNLFKGSGSFVDSETNEFDTLLVDEAHRLNKKSGMFKNLGENQIKEIVNAAKCSIFFIDKSQKVDINDNGSIEEIKKYINKAGAEYEVMKLESQFRCNGSDGYISWLDSILEIEETANEDGFDIDYDIQVFDDPNEMKEKIFEKNKEENKARLLAGYCWKWNKEGKNKSDIHDISIPEYNFSMSWNLGNSSTWAIDEASVNEVGCIHTSQGLEFDYVGVIVGEDLRYEKGSIVTDFTKRASTDKSIFGMKKLYKENPENALKLADEIIKNTYRTLMTRGQKGCYIYCEDKALAKYFKEKISGKTMYKQEVAALSVAEDPAKYTTSKN